MASVLAVRSLLVSVVVAGIAGCGGGPSADTSNALVGDTSRGSVSLQLGDTSQTNLSPTHVRANQISVAYYDPASGSRTINIGGWIDEGGGSFSKDWQIGLVLYGEPATGKVFPIDALDTGLASGAPDTAWLRLQDGGRDWSASSGSVTVQSLVSPRATFSIDAVTMSPIGGTAVGTFTMNGSLVITNVNSVCDFCLD
jgi:hypothetical protein